MPYGSRKRGLRLKLVFVVVTAAAALAIPTSARASDVGTLQARVDQARTQARSLASVVQTRAAQFQAAAASATAAAQRQVVLEVELAHGQQRLAKLQARVARAAHRLRVAQARFHREQRKLAARLVAIYKSDTPDLTSVLLESDGFNDLLTRATYLKEINKADTALVDRVKELRDQVKSALEQVKALRAQAAAEVRRLAAARDQIAQVRRAAQARAAAAERARAVAQSSLDELHSRIAGWTAQVQELQNATGQPGNAGQTVNQWFGDFAIPQSIVQCESSGNYQALNPTSGAGGAYQLLPSTYKALGGKYKAPNLAPKWEQDKLAAKLWNNGAGAGNWVCAGR